MWDNDDSIPVELDLEFGMAYDDSGGDEGNEHQHHGRLAGARQIGGDGGQVYESDSYYRDDFIDIGVEEDRDDDDGSDDDAIFDDLEIKGGDASGDEGFASQSSSTMRNKIPRKIYQPSSLLHLATQTVASNLEMINPGAIGLLSEYHWDAVVYERAKKYNPSMESSDKSGKVSPLIAMDGKAGKRLLPALSEKILIVIEQHPNNIHLSKSKTADDLIWQEIVDYTFSGLNRPQSLEVPYSIVKERLHNLGDDLLENLSCPMSEDEFAKSLVVSQPLLLNRRNPADDEEQEDISRKRKRTEESDVMNDKDLKATSINKKSAVATDDGSLSAINKGYQQYLELESQHRTNNLQFLLVRLAQTPMDVVLLAEIGIGKRINKCIKIMKRLMKANKANENFLRGYPRFWKPCRWDDALFSQEKHSWCVIRKFEMMAPFEVMQQILQDWKEMASLENGVEATLASTSHPPTKPVDKAVSISTCGRGKNISLSQHRIDMELLHSSPDWRSLYQSLKYREGIVKKIQGDRVRSIRENLEKARPKIGKVVLKKAVDRVKGNDGKDIRFQSSPEGKTPSKVNSVGDQNNFQVRQQERREAILSKSLGHRYRQQHMIAQNGSPHSGNGKLSQIRSESKVAASWSKSSYSESSTASSAFGSAVARACGKNGNGSDRLKKQQKQGSQVHVELGNGKQMKLPPSFISGTGKTVGAFASLQKRMSQNKK
jgi:hypothetical protein